MVYLFRISVIVSGIFSVKFFPLVNSVVKSEMSETPITVS